jgi:pimeloyl-ACP methyl ester carboxylesterase
MPTAASTASVGSHVLLNFPDGNHRPRRAGRLSVVGGPSDTTFVLVHGLGGSHLNWLQVAEALGAGRVVALDLPGFGRSPAAGRGTRVMDLGARSPGSSTRRRAVTSWWGTRGRLIASVEAAVDPDRVTGLVLSASVFHGPAAASPPTVLAKFSPAASTALVSAWCEPPPVDEPGAFVRVGLRLLTPTPA